MCQVELAALQLFCIARAAADIYFPASDKITFRRKDDS
jgi:hypothetical protein